MGILRRLRGNPETELSRNLNYARVQVSLCTLNIASMSSLVISIHWLCKLSYKTNPDKSQ
jgi:hypothetical protein